MGTNYDAAYAAGVLDGEGSISMTRVGGQSRKAYWRIVVAVSNCDLPLVEFLHDRWGGSKLVGMNRGENKRPQHRWTVVGHSARDFLAAVRPYLLVKAERADWAQEVLELQNRPRKAFEPFPEGVRERLAELRGVFDTDRSRSWAARGRKWEA